MQYPLHPAATDTTPTLSVLRLVHRLRRVLPAGISGLALLLTTAAHAQAPGKHVHGQAELDIAIEKDTITLMLVSPLDNILGFEHTHRSEHEREQVNAAQKALAQGDRLFVIDEGAGCKTEQVSTPALHAKASPAENARHDDHAHPTEDTHNHAGHTDTHTDAELTVQYNCTSGDTVRFIDASALFSTFPRLQTLQVQIAGPSQQKGMTIQRSSARISLQR